MDEEKNNRLEEPTVAYGYRRQTISYKRLEEKYPWLKEYSNYREELEAWMNPVPYTKEELRARVDAAQREIDAGAKGITKEDLFSHFERLKRQAHAYECNHLE